MAHAIIYKPRLSMGNVLRSVWNDMLVGNGGEYKLDLHSVLVPDNFVLGRFARDRKGIYSCKPEYFRFSQEKEELNRVIGLVNSGKVTVVEEYEMDLGVVDDLKRRFEDYQRKLETWKEAHKAWKDCRSELERDAGIRLAEGRR